LKKNIKTITYVGLAFLISLGVLFSFLEMYENGLITQEQIHKIESANADQIFLIGISYVNQINSKHVENTLQENNIIANVLNVERTAIPETYNEIGKFIANTPKIIVYGVSFRELGYLDGSHCTFNNILKYEKDYYPIINIDSENNVKHNMNNPFSVNPKQTTIKVLEKFLGESKTIIVTSQSDSKPKIILTDEKLDEIHPITELAKGHSDPHCMHWGQREHNLNVLGGIFPTFKENNIEVIVFIPPVTKAYLDTLEPALRLELTNDLKSIAKEYDLDFYDLSSEFEGLDIWKDHTHVANNPNSMIYSEKIASMIISKYTENNSQQIVEFNSDLFNSNLSGVDLTFIDFSGKDFSGKNFSDSNLHGSSLFKTKLNSTNFQNSDLSGVDLSGADLSGADLSGADLSGADLSGADLSGADLSGVDLSGADLSGADLSGADLSGADLSGADLSGADLSGADLSGVDLSGADLSGADLSGVDLMNVNLQGKDLSGAILRGVDLSGVDLSGVDLRGVDLSGADLSGADLSGVNLEYANLSGAYLVGVDLRGVDLRGVDLRGADLSGVDLRETIFRGPESKRVDESGVNYNETILSGADLSGVDLSGVDLSGVDLSGVDLSGVDLSGVDLSGSSSTEVDLSGSSSTEVDLSGSQSNGK
jgi:uncharacterized protein YjbI with pentapeptide repeats